MPTLVFSDPDGNLLMVCQRIALTQDQIQRVTTFLARQMRGSLPKGRPLTGFMLNMGWTKIARETENQFNPTLSGDVKAAGIAAENYKFGEMF